MASFPIRTKPLYPLFFRHGFPYFFFWLGMVWITQNVCLAGGPVETYLHPLANPVPRQVRFTLSIQNPTGKTLADQEIWFYGPVTRTATQQLEKLDIDAEHQIQKDELGNQIIKVHFDSIAPYSTKLVNIKADLLMSSQPSPSLLKRTDIFLNEELYIERDDREIQRIAANVKLPLLVDTVSGIYQWVKTNMSYAGYIADDLGAKYAALNRRGDCTEYAYLTTALARAAGIPARSLGGYVISHNSVLKAGEYHNWAEVYVDGAWRLLDAQKENYQANIEQYLAMRVISTTLFNSIGTAHRFHVNGEIVVRMN